MFDNILLDTICFEYLYSKTQSIKGKQTAVVRFLPREVADLLASYLTKIRPLEALIFSFTSPNLKSSFPTTLWVTAKGEPMNGSMITETVSRIWDRFLLPLGFLEFRHLAIGIMAAHGLNFDEDFSEDELVLSGQAGHAPSTSRIHYGRAFNETPDAPARQYLAFESCVAYHRLLGLRFAIQDFFNFQILFEIFC